LHTKDIIMKRIILILFTGLSITGHAQNSALLSDTIVSSTETTIYTYLRKGAQKIREGSYQQWNQDGIKTVKGQYLADKKHGTWSYFNHSDGDLIAEGTYTNGLKAGFWEYYSRGDIRLIYDHDNLEISFISPEFRDHETVVYYQTKPTADGDLIEITPERIPQSTNHISPYDHGAAWLQENEDCVNLVDNLQFWYVIDEWGYLQDAGSNGITENECEIRFKENLLSYYGDWVPAIIEGFMTDVMIYYEVYK
jgi:hypothetical protein